MRKAALASAATAALIAAAGTISIAAASTAAPPTASTALVFSVKLSPFFALHLNPKPDPHTGFGPGDEITFHDLLFSHGTRAGDEGGSCVIVDGGQALANCTEVIRLRQGTITAQFLNAPPPRKQLAITGGTGTYRDAGGDGTLVESGNGTGTLTLHLLDFPHRNH